MAKMIPRNIDPETKSDAEKKIYLLLRDMPDTDNWTVLHSVSIAVHPTQVQGEADFVVLIPDKGAFVLEVKGGGIAYSEGIWTSRDRAGNIFEIKNPANEANQAMHALINHLAEPCGYVFGFGVVFPNSEFSKAFDIPDLANEQIADIGDCRNIKKYLLRLAVFWRNRYPQYVAAPDKSRCEEFLRHLRPDFDSAVSAGTIIRNMENRIIELTENQQAVFDGLSENDRCLVKGSAGTGKTILAVNFAIQLCESGKRVALFCYNRLLADYIKTKLSSSQYAACGSFTDYAERMVTKYHPELNAASFDDNREKRDHYYKVLLPEMLSYLFLEDKIQQFDYLIIDEAQDLMSCEYLDTFDVLLKGGLTEGNWCMFMDAEKQNLYHATITEEKVKDLLKARKCFCANYVLKDNCRNSKSIIEKLDQWFGTETRSHLSFEYEFDVGIFSYKKTERAAAILTELLKKLIDEGVSRKDINILSPHRLSSSCASLVTEYRISDDSSRPQSAYYFSTIQAYKGLESPVIILTDIDQIFGDLYKNILYVGMTRARSALYIIASDRVYKILNGGKNINELS